MDAGRRETVIAIDLLRVVAAGLVVLYHFGASLPLHPSWQVAGLTPRLPAGAAAWTWFGWVGVELFFVISGLVIAASARGAAPLPFLRRRALRLYPAAWVCGSVTALLMLAAAPAVAIGPAWARSLLLWPTAVPVDPSWWTLSLELGFYLLIAAVLTGGGGPARLEQATALLGGASCAFWVVAGATGTTRLAEDFGFQLTLLPHGCFFAAGALIGAPRWRWLVAACVGAGVAEIVSHARTVTATLSVAGSPALPVAVFLVGIAVIGARARVQPALTRIVGERRAARAGAVTYPLYLLHQVAGAIVATALIRGGCPPVAAVLLALAAVTATACIVAWRIEPAIRAALSRRHGPARDNRPTASLPAG